MAPKPVILLLACHITLVFSLSLYDQNSNENDFLKVHSKGFSQNDILNMEQNTLSGATEEEIQMILDVHNDLRRLQGASNMNLLKWSSPLANVAQKMTESCDMSTKHSLLAFGQTSHHFEGTPSLRSLNESIHTWYDEHQYYNYEHNTCMQGKTCSNFKQMVLASMEFIGCSYTTCNQTQGVTLFVCLHSDRYAEIEVPYQQGEACTACGGTSPACDDGLCYSSYDSKTPGRKLLVTCSNCGTPAGSTCTCPPGYKGNLCDEECTYDEVACRVAVDDSTYCTTSTAALIYQTKCAAVCDQYKSPPGECAACSVYPCPDPCPTTTVTEGPAPTTQTVSTTTECPLLATGCQNCGTFDEVNCECTCPVGYAGSDCGATCEDAVPNTCLFISQNLVSCTDEPFKSQLEKDCALSCGLCAPCYDSCGIPCSTITVPTTTTLPETTPTPTTTTPTTTTCPTCQNCGTPSDCACICPDGYYGEECENLCEDDSVICNGVTTTNCEDTLLGDLFKKNCPDTCEMCKGCSQNPCPDPCVTTTPTTTVAPTTTCEPCENCGTLDEATCTCECPEGFYGPTCADRCEDANPTDCNLIRGGYSCSDPLYADRFRKSCAATCEYCASCKSGYCPGCPTTVPDTTTTTTVPPTTPTETTTTTTVTTPPTTCTPCMNCAVQNPTDCSCSCPDGYYGPLCENFCEDNEYICGAKGIPFSYCGPTFFGGLFYRECLVSCKQCVECSKNPCPDPCLTTTVLPSPATCPECQNCGTPGPGCTCSCSVGYTGSTCEEECIDDPAICGDPFDADSCNNPKLGDEVRKACPVRCGICTPCSGVCPDPCQTTVEELPTFTTLLTSKAVTCAPCENCGTLDEDTCSCSCSIGYWGPTCSDKCTDTQNTVCNLAETDPGYYCNDHEDKDVIRSNCPASCGLCTPCNGPCPDDPCTTVAPATCPPCVNCGTPFSTGCGCDCMPGFWGDTCAAPCIDTEPVICPVVRISPGYFCVEEPYREAALILCPLACGLCVECTNPEDCECITTIPPTVTTTVTSSTSTTVTTQTTTTVPPTTTTTLKPTTTCPPCEHCAAQREDCTCICPAGWYGDYCEKPCKDKGVCAIANNQTRYCNHSVYDIFRKNCPVFCDYCEPCTEGSCLDPCATTTSTTVQTVLSCPQCENCGTLDEDTCQCQCPSGYWGPTCSDRCADSEVVICEVASSDPDYYCTDQKLGDYTRKMCPAICKLCERCADPCPDPCPVTTTKTTTPMVTTTRAGTTQPQTVKPTTQCNLQCEHCGILDTKTCTCSCPAGWWGTSCQDECKNDPELCESLAEDLTFCWHPVYGILFQNNCPGMCGFCDTCPEPCPDPCGTTTQVATTPAPPASTCPPCENCGTLDESTCTCSCAPGWHGPTCTEPCEDLVTVTCNTAKTDPPFYCTDPQYNPYTVENCPVACGLCEPCPDPCPFVCGFRTTKKYQTIRVTHYQTELTTTAAKTVAATTTEKTVANNLETTTKAMDTTTAAPAGSTCPPCKNCGVLDKTTCSCICPMGYHGAQCDTRCVDRNTKTCNVTRGDSKNTMCNHPVFGDIVKRDCPAACSLCEFCPEPCPDPCANTVAPPTTTCDPCENCGIQDPVTCECECPTGFYGKRCEYKCQDLHETCLLVATDPGFFCVSNKYREFSQTYCQESCGICEPCPAPCNPCSDFNVLAAAPKQSAVNEQLTGENSEKAADSKFPSWGIAVIAALGGLVLAVIIAIVVVRLRHPRSKVVDKASSSDQLEPSFPGGFAASGAMAPWYQGTGSTAYRSGKVPWYSSELPAGQSAASAAAAAAGPRPVSKRESLEWIAQRQAPWYSGSTEKGITRYMPRFYDDTSEEPERPANRMYPAFQPSGVPTPYQNR